MSSKTKRNVKDDPLNGFGVRFKEAFQNKPNADIARSLGVSDPAITNYIKGRIPSARKLIEISDLTGCNLHWLLTGQGEKLIEISQDRMKPLLIKGGKGGAGTSTSAMIFGVVLAFKGYRTLLVGNTESINTNLISLHKNLDFYSAPSVVTAKTDGYCTTSIENLDLFIGKGSEYDDHAGIKVKPFDKSDFDIRREYDFTILDILGFDNPSMNISSRFDSLLTGARLIIPYQPLNSTLELANKVLGDFSVAAGYPSSFLGLFISNEYEKTIIRRHYEFSKSRVRDNFGEKMFKTIVRHDFNGLEEFMVDTDIDKFKNTKLFTDYSNLIDEILERLKIS